jgi:hypothetical protein
MKIIYERDLDVGDGYQAFRGTFCESAGQEQSFSGLHFAELLRRTHELLLKNDDKELIFVRSDRPELLAHRLDDELTELIMRDVDKAIEKMSHPTVRVVVGRPPAPPVVVRAGADTLAASIGERVLCRRRDAQVECPGCGAWAQTQGHSLSCGHCKMQMLFEPENDQWVSVSTADLISSHVPKFFLPREWNGYKPWIQRSELIELLDKSMKAKGAFNAVE